MLQIIQERTCCVKAEAVIIKTMNLGGKWKEENGGGRGTQLTGRTLEATGRLLFRVRESKARRSEGLDRESCMGLRKQGGMRTISFMGVTERM